MSVQILLQGKILGTNDFLLAGDQEESRFTGRLRWASLLSEVLPRALIEELGLSKMLLGSSGGDQFLVVLPQEMRAQSEQFLTAARAELRLLSRARLDLLWAITENLGDWTVVRKRLNDEFQRKQGTPLAATGLMEAQPADESDDGYFADLSRLLPEATALGWSPQVRFAEGLGQTVGWYRDSSWWWEPIRSGAYREYYARQYGSTLG